MIVAAIRTSNLNNNIGAQLYTAIRQHEELDRITFLSWCV